MRRLFLVVLAVFSLFHGLANTGLWLKKASLGGQGRHRGVGAEAWNRGYIGLGHVNGAGADISFKDWWEYNPATDSWTQRADYPVADHGAVCFSVENLIYVGGGSAFTNQFYVYDPLSNLWSNIANCPLSPGDVQGFSASGKGYVIFQNQLAEYEPQTDSWTLKANVPVTVGNWSCCFSNGSSGFVKVGHSLFEYKPLQNTWISRANHPGLSTGGSYGFCINGIGYVTSGYVGGLATVTEEVWSFNPATNTWTQVSHFLGSSRRFSVSFSIGNKGYVGTGTNGINLNDFWEFDPTKTLAVPSLENNEILLYPNPTYLTLGIIGLQSQTEYEIFSLTGKKIHSGVTQGEINMVDFHPGHYFILINGKTYAFSKI